MVNELSQQLTTDVMFRVPTIKEASLYAARNLSDAGNQLYMISYDDNIGETAFGVNRLGEWHKKIFAIMDFRLFRSRKP